MFPTEPSEREPESGTASFTSGESGTAKDLVTIRDEETFRINDYVMSYGSAGSQPATVELYDDPEGTGEANVSELIETVRISSGDTLPVNNIARNDVEDDVVVVVRNNNAQVDVTLGGYTITG